MSRRSAYLAAYELLEEVQSERQAAAAAALPAARLEAQAHDWPDVELVLDCAQAVHALTRPQPGHISQPGDLNPLIDRAVGLGASGLHALTLALRAVAAAAVGDSATLMADASRAVALLDDEQQPALDRCTAYVVAAAAFNSLGLWELVTQLYGDAADLERACGPRAQVAALAVNQVLIRVEWAASLIESGREPEGQEQLAQAMLAVPAARAAPLPPLWRTDIEALVAISALLRGADPDAAMPFIAELRRDLLDGGDIEVLPLLDAATALALWRHGARDRAVELAASLTPSTSASSGARSFPLWVRAHVLAANDPSEAAVAQRDHAALQGQIRWQMRETVLVAARSQIAAERHRAEHERLSRAVVTDPLTGLHNRRTFDAWLARPTPHGLPPTALLLIDLDDFKVVNDTHGHDYGDEVLRRFGRLLLAWVRPGDLAARLGGDEFAVLLEDDHLTTEAAAQRAWDLIAGIAAEPWYVVAPALTISASIGVAVSVSPTEPSAESAADTNSAAALYRTADAALYAAKREGTGMAIDTVPGRLASTG